ncbi:aldehyde dehydrogenase family protein [Amycolatopsis sp. DSM 110486]|nr:aldehyde dehydrogenase family protein [Amycolatopsis sp. DSM 110486]
MIPAFNSPMLLGSMSLAPATAAGNTVVVKSPEVNPQAPVPAGQARHAGRGSRWCPQRRPR